MSGGIDETVTDIVDLLPSILGFLLSEAALVREPESDRSRRHMSAVITVQQKCDESQTGPGFADGGFSSAAELGQTAPFRPNQRMTRL
jgi:hypothetical protein